MPDARLPEAIIEDGYPAMAKEKHGGLDIDAYGNTCLSQPLQTAAIAQ